MTENTKKRGFFAWLKRLFGFGKKETVEQPKPVVNVPVEKPEKAEDSTVKAVKPAAKKETKPAAKKPAAKKAPAKKPTAKKTASKKGAKKQVRKKAKK